MNKVITILVVSSIVTGCAQMPGTAGNPAARDQAMTEGCVGGALLGTALGAGMGALLGGGQGAAIGAGAGALVGGAGGCAIANSITKDNAQLTGKENDLDSQIQYATNMAKETQAHNQQLALEVKAAKLKVAQIKKDIKHKRASKSQLTEQKRVLDEKMVAERQHENRVSSSINNLVAFRTKQPKGSQALDKQITELQAQLKTLKKSNQALAAISQKI